LSLINKLLITDLDSQFITLFFARLDPQTATVNWSDAGHGICWLFRPSGAASRLADTKNSGPPSASCPTTTTVFRKR
jgi:serine phosphatase RsbU (regulator of sigma subunit)